MAQPSNGITPEVIRDLMPPYELSPDLLQATFAAIPRPPPAATPEWTRTKLDEGPGWSREALRHRSSLEPESATSPSPLEGLDREERTKGRGEGSFSP
jgi:hypothetical protein